mgnify:CR=1 FL=1|tara:strand:- start:2734 stop:3612 length:879 start_codon:yes stop_codon:yes gene_type:complete
MVKHQCEICYKIFKQKGHLERHNNRKFPCKSSSLLTEKKMNGTDRPKKFENEEKIQINNSNLYKCMHCNKEYKYKQHLNRHEKQCIIKIENQLKEKLFNLLIKQNEEHKKENLFLKQQINLLQKELNEQSNQINKLSINNINSNNINCNNKTINILAYNKTDLSHITDKEFEMIMGRCHKSVPTLIKKTHYDPGKPENKNIYISNIKDKYIMAWDGIKWNLKNRDETLDDIYENSSNILEDKIETWEINKYQYNPIAVKKFYKFLNNKENDEIRNKIKENIKLILYNNRINK